MSVMVYRSQKQKSGNYLHKDRISMLIGTDLRFDWVIQIVLLLCFNVELKGFYSQDSERSGRSFH